MKDSAMEKQDSGRVNEPLRLADCGSRRKTVLDRVMEKILMSAICLFILWSFAGDAVSCNLKCSRSICLTPVFRHASSSFHAHQSLGRAMSLGLPAMIILNVADWSRSHLRAIYSH